MKDNYVIYAINTAGTEATLITNTYNNKRSFTKEQAAFYLQISLTTVVRVSKTYAVTKRCIIRKYKNLDMMPHTLPLSDMVAAPMYAIYGSNGILSLKYSHLGLTGSEVVDAIDAPERIIRNLLKKKVHIFKVSDRIVQQIEINNIPDRADIHML